MKRTSYKRVLIVLAAIVAMTGACLKPSDSDLLVSHTKPVTTEEIVKTLAGRSELSLYNKAFIRVGTNGKLPPNKGATIFAPTNEAMQAAGYTEARINSMALAELARMVNYHIVPVAMTPQGIISKTLTAIVETLRQDTIYKPGTGNRIIAPLLYVSGQNKLFINDVETGDLTKNIVTSNGYIYPIDRILQPVPKRNLIEILDNNPDFSLFRSALKIADSIRQDAILQWDMYYEEASSDSWMLSRNIDRSIGDFTGGLPTVIAPTNKAFEAAGLHSENDLRDLANKNPLRIDADWEAGAYLVFHSSLDSIVRMHLFLGGLFSPFFYHDMQQPLLNNKWYNDYNRDVNGWGAQTQLKFPFRPVFSWQNNQAFAQWKNDPAAKALVQKYPGDGSITDNGNIYFTDQLFYTPR
ncbi:fasciclin domain-containing protein [Chitinophaga pendula]|uniref:fasciclin domain-containing protein n=1 Tax=Chitinophaga TaxID=79328 RepID=UPI000BAF7ECE|nr:MULTISPECIES: fasciclin domain-containing protein [Chitinophaga]ASZ12147.1 hypothetical protein CK934_14855 [Chitinophaga sp. MD30]UCJ04813.1 fasciclin domain-containing protein [Chitinophaga pendula]